MYKINRMYRDRNNVKNGKKVMENVSYIMIRE